MNEAVKIGSYEDDDYHVSKNSSAAPFQSDMFYGGLLSMLCISSNPLGIPTVPARRRSRSFERQCLVHTA